MNITTPSSSLGYDHARCGYCGVVHLGADGKPVICPLLRPQPAPRPVYPHDTRCPTCGRAA